jgi:flagellar hook-associated protein 2
MSLALSGVYTGIDADALVEAGLMADTARIKRYETRQATWESKITAVEELERRFTELESFTGALDSIKELRKTSVRSSDKSIMTASSSGGASEGNHTIEVNKLATSEKLVHDGVEALDTALGAGKFAFSYNGETRTYTTTADTTIEDLVDLINNDADNPGVSASILEYEVDPTHKYHLVLSGQDVGEDYTITINDAVTTVPSFDTADFTVSQVAQDAEIRVDGYPAGNWIKKSSNSLSDIIPGVTINLVDTGTVNLSVSRDTAKLKEDLGNMVNIYNGLVTKYNEYGGYNEETGKGGILQGDSTMNGLLMQVRNLMTSPVVGFQDGDDPLTLPAQLGFSFDDKTGKLEFDSSVFDEAVAEDYQTVLNLLGASESGATNDANFQFTSSLSVTQPGIYDVRATFDATGTLTGAEIRKKGEDGTSWRAATINATDGTITGVSGNDEAGLLIQVVNPTPGSTEEFEVRVQQGFMAGLREKAEEITDVLDGPLTVQKEEYETALEQVREQIDSMEQQLVRKEERLRQKYARLEATLAELDQMKQAVTSMAQSLASNRKAASGNK